MNGKNVRVTSRDDLQDLRQKPRLIVDFRDQSECRPDRIVMEFFNIIRVFVIRAAADSHCGCRLINRAHPAGCKEVFDLHNLPQDFRNRILADQIIAGLSGIP